MKSLPRALVLIAGLLVAGLPAVTAQSQPPVVRNPDGSIRIPAELLLDEIKATPYENRAALRQKLAEAEKRFADRLPEWESRKNALPEKERLAAEADFNRLLRAREVLRQKIDTVELAGKETWESAKSDLHVVLLNTIEIYKKLHARFEQ
jgi:predicted metal-dependent hydrolase